MNLNGLTRTDGFNSLTDASALMQSASDFKKTNEFESLLKKLSSSSEENKKAQTNISSSEINSTRKLNGDYTQGFHNAFTSEADRHAKPSGAAASSKAGKTIDKTSALYEQAMELENYFVKEMLSSMRKTISRTNLMGGEKDYAQEMYEDMLYDNYSEALTKSAGFGLADQIYLELTGTSVTA